MNANIRVAKCKLWGWDLLAIVYQLPHCFSTAATTFCYSEAIVQYSKNQFGMAVKLADVSVPSPRVAFKTHEVLLPIIQSALTLKEHLAELCSRKSPRSLSLDILRLSSVSKVVLEMSKLDRGPHIRKTLSEKEAYSVHLHARTCGQTAAGTKICMVYMNSILHQR